MGLLINFLLNSLFVKIYRYAAKTWHLDSKQLSSKPVCLHTLSICCSSCSLSCNLIYHQLKVFLISSTSDPPARRSKLKPPGTLSANQSSAGVVLQWSHPEPQHPPITGFVLQSRTEQGEWFHLDANISANTSEIIVPGLHKVTSQSHCSLRD